MIIKITIQSFNGFSARFLRANPLANYLKNHEEKSINSITLNCTLNITISQIDIFHFLSDGENNNNFFIALMQINYDLNSLFAREKNRTELLNLFVFSGKICQQLFFRVLNYVNHRAN
jgi:hypothetical protein